MKTVGLISLGCDKNRTDSENILFQLREAGFALVPDVQNADIVIVNTCAFIEAAKKESIDTILEFVDTKREGQTLVVVGCMAQRYGEELKKELPEVDIIAGVNSYHKIAEIIAAKKALTINAEYTPFTKGRVLTTPPHYSYLKISEGCNNNCTYCAIPKIRGKYRSEKFEDLIKEAEGLVNDGVKEIMLVAEDITRYGEDIYGKNRLYELLKELVKLPVYKYRLMYAYPDNLPDNIIELISSEEKIAKYVDIPLQHVSDSVLKRMNRKTGKESITALLDKIRTINPEIAIRSTFITGFPGETEAEFNELHDFIKSARINYAGFFAYSQEEGTFAGEMPGQLPKSVRNKRQNVLSKAQSAVIVESQSKYLGQTLPVIYEDIDYKRNLFVGRTEFNAPNIDTLVYFSSKTPLDVGNIYDVKITKTGFDLCGEN
ncbi:MAG: 30S ribosomal protein S12 methylthiotransferase RimO [Christensenellaceae bacterium]|jgi:ribosomal protein S12 methylthiotransferase|nr:30S ribosomal protein S12 methylthiotransferase RimO [Christensenellaceae bacterium]